MFKFIFLLTSVILLCLATACAASQPSYTAHVWEDADGDGRQSEEEMPMEGIVIQIVD